MPKSQRPRHLRLVPPYKRDLQNDAKAASAPVAAVRRGLSSRTKTGLAIAGGVGLVGASLSPPAQRTRRKAKIGGLAYRASPEFRQLPRSERKRVINQMSDQVEQHRALSKAAYNVTSGTNVRRVTPRTPSGQFVSHTNDLMVIHPAFKTDGRRAPRDSKLQVWGKGKDKASRTFVGKADTLSLTEALNAGGNSRGRRLA